MDGSTKKVLERKSKQMSKALMRSDPEFRAVQEQIKEFRKFLDVMWELLPTTSPSAFVRDVPVPYRGWEEGGIIPREAFFGLATIVKGNMVHHQTGAGRKARIRFWLRRLESVWLHAAFFAKNPGHRESYGAVFRGRR